MAVAWPHALIWDVDGTLAETEHDGHRVAFNRAFADSGLDWNWDEATYARLLGVAGGKERLHAAWSETSAEVPPQGLIEGLHRAKTRHYLALLAQGGIALRPGVKALSDEAAAAGVVQAIATTTTAENIPPLLAGRLDDPGRFAVIGAGDVVAEKKPAPDIYHWVLERLGLAPADCCAVEDSPAGAQAAAAAGIPVLVTRSRYTRGLPLALPPGAVLLADLDDLSGITLARLRTMHTAQHGGPAHP